MQPRPFSDAEYAARRVAAANAAAASGLDALLVVSRGGGTSDRHGNLVYLANAYTSFPFIPDNPPLWSGRGHAVLLLPSQGEAELLLDVPYGPFDDIAIDSVRVHPDLIAAVSDVIRERGLDRGRIGLVGSDVLPVKWYWALVEALPSLEWVAADDILDQQRVIKSAAEQDVMREVARRGVSVMTNFLAAAEPGRPKGELMGVGLASMAKFGLLPYDLRLGTGVDLSRSFLAHLPGSDYDERLVAGDLFRVDIVASWHGYYVDFARSIVIGNLSPSDEQRRLLRAARDSVRAVIGGIKPGVTGSQLTEIGLGVLREYGVIGPPGSESSSQASGFAGFGHSVGVAWESPWIDAHNTTPLASGMCLSVEKKVGFDGVGAATYEDMVLVHDTSIEVLTAAAPYAPID